MKYRVLGKELKVSEVGLGCMGFSHASGAPMEKNEAVKVLQQAFDMGYIQEFMQTEAFHTMKN